MRFAAALSWLCGWLCATTEGVPDRMLDLFVEVVGLDLAGWMQDVPWTDHIAERGGLVAWLGAFVGETPTAQARLTSSET